MNLILATINGPAFCPLPGIGRIFTTRDIDESQLAPPDPEEELTDPRDIAVVDAIRNGENTRSKICIAANVPVGSIYPTLQRLLKHKHIYVVKEGLRGHVETIYGVKP